MEELKPSDKEATSCKKDVMSRIECGEVCPRSKTFFQTRECVVWALWGLSVLVGALAVAVTTFAFMHHQYALYEATHNNFLTFLVDVLPLIWVAVFVLMLGIGVYEIRRTKSGYRYPLWQSLGSSVLVSAVGGIALHYLGMGYSVDRLLGENIHMYNSQEKMEEYMWQNPEDGRLVGRVVGQLAPPALVLSFEDISGKTWQVNISDLSSPELDLLSEEKNVRLIGLLDDETELFHSCGAFPWSLEGDVSKADLAATRETFLTKMHSYEEQMEHKMGYGDEDNKSKKVKESLCVEMKPVRRMRGDGF